MMLVGRLGVLFDIEALSASMKAADPDAGSLIVLHTDQAPGDLPRILVLFVSVALGPMFNLGRARPPSDRHP